MDTLKTKLAEYGKVVTCGGNDETFNVVIGTGFNTSTISDCFNLISNTISDTYPRLKNMVCSNGKFECIFCSE